MATRYLDPALDGLAPDELARADAAFYARRRRELTVLGLDVSTPAIRYARRCGLLDGGWCENLERDEPSADLIAGIRDVGLIISTGGVGYVGYRTFDRILTALAHPEDLWLAVFVLRVFDYAPIAARLARDGLVTERVEGVTFPQRRFVDRVERDAAVDDVCRLGLDPEGKEADGWFHAECFVTRPAGASPPNLFGARHAFGH